MKNPEWAARETWNENGSQCRAWPEIPQTEGEQNNSEEILAGEASRQDAKSFALLHQFQLCITFFSRPDIQCGHSAWKSARKKSTLDKVLGGIKQTNLNNFPTCFFFPRGSLRLVFDICVGANAGKVVEKEGGRMLQKETAKQQQASGQDRLKIPRK